MDPTQALVELLPQLISFFAGISTGLAFVSGSRMRWF